MRNKVLLLAALLAGCGTQATPSAAPPNVEAVRDSVGAFMDTVPAALAARGPLAWLDFFEDTPQFLMASDGRAAFESRDAAAAFLTDFATTVSAMELHWQDMRIEPLGSGIATIAAAYEESITDRKGAVVSFGGYVTGVVRNTGEAWKLQHLHWSSPVSN